jgi:hypothetical protein
MPCPSSPLEPYAGPVRVAQSARETPDPLAARVSSAVLLAFAVLLALGSCKGPGQEDGETEGVACDTFF